MTISGAVSDGGLGASLTKSGAGTLVLANTNSYSGMTTVTGGMLLLGSPAAVQNSTVDLAVGYSLAFGSSIGTFTFGGLSDEGNLDLTDANGAGVALRVGNNGQSTIYSGNLSGTGASLTKIGGGTLVLTGSNSYDSGTNANAGAVSVSSDVNLGSGGVTLSGGTLDITGGSFSSAKTVTIVSGAIDVSGAATLSGSIGGGGPLTKTDGGLLTVTNTANGYAGGTNVNGGTLNFNAASTLGSGPISFNGGALQWAAGNTADISMRTVTINAGGATIDSLSQNLNLANTIGNGGAGGLTLSPGTATITLGGSNTVNTYRGGTTLTGGELLISTSSALGTPPAATMTFLHFTGNSTLALDGNVTLTNKENVVIDSGASVTFDNYYPLAETNSYQYNLTIPGVVSGGGAIVKSNNNGVLYLAGSNTFSGGTVIVGDTSGWNTSNIVEINSDASLGTAPSIPATNISITAGYTAELEFANGFAAYSASSSLNPNRTIYTSANYSGGGGAGLNVQSNNITLANLITGPGTLQETGAGNLYLTNTANSFGGFRRWNGTIDIIADGCLGTAPSAPTANMGEYNATATLQAGASFTLDANRNFSFDYTGGFTLDTQGYTVTWNGQLVSNGYTATFTKKGSGLLIMGGSNSATFTNGSYVVAGGVLRADDGAAISSVNVNLTGGEWESDAPITRPLGSGTGQVQLSGTSGFSAYGNAINVNLGGAASTVTWGNTGFTPSVLVLGASTANSALNFQNAIDLHGSTRTIEVDAGPGFPATISGAIGNSTGTAGLTKSGLGTLLLAGSDTYNGTTTVNAGTLTFADMAALYDGSSGSWTPTKITVAPGAVLGIGLGNAASGYFDANALTTLLNGSHLGASTTTTGLKTEAILGLDTTNAGGTFAYSGSIANAGSSGSTGLAKLGPGTLVLSGTNTYTGGTLLAAGTLSLAGSGAIGASGTITFAGGTLQFTATDTRDYTSGTDRFSNSANQAYNIDTNGQTVTLSGNLTSSGGSLTKLGAGTLVLSGTNTYNGGTTVSGGILDVLNATALADGSNLTVGADAGSFFAPLESAALPASAGASAAVPEPGTLALLTLAASGFAVSRLMGRRGARPGRGRADQSEK